MTLTQHLQKSVEEFEDKFTSQIDDGVSEYTDLKVSVDYKEIESFWLAKIREAYLIAAEEVEGMKANGSYQKTDCPAEYDKALTDAANRLRCGQL